MARTKGEKGKGLLAFFFCIPLAFILYFFISYSSQSVSVQNVNKVTVTVGETVSEFDSASDIEFFVDMLTRSRSISSAMRDVSEEAPVVIQCERQDKIVEYKLYPSLNFSGCLLVGPDGKLFALETETAKSLLLRNEFEYMYSGFFLPTLSVVSGEDKSDVAPINSQWSYYKSDGNVYSYSPDSYADGSGVYTIRKGFENKLSFTPNGEVRPYDMRISCMAENGTQYEITDISQIDLSVDTLLTVKVDAVWPLRSGVEAYGEASYEFKLMYDIPAEVEIINTDVTVGEFIEVHATHLNADELVELKSGDNTYQLKFGIVKEDKGVALLPVALGTEVGTYEIEIVAGVNVTNATITVVASDNTNEKFITVNNAVYESELSLAAMESLQKTLSGIVQSRPQKNYFIYEKWALGAPIKGIEPNVEFGTKVYFGGYDAAETGDRICNGITYDSTEGKQVVAAQAGEVVFSGNLNATGNTVVVYHGYGIYTYYFHLDTISVQTGYILGDKEAVGTVGTTGFTNGKAVLHFATSIDGVFVDPQTLL